MSEETTMDFLPETFDLLKEQLTKDHDRWGNTWKHRDVGGAVERIYGKFRDYYDQWKNGKTPIPWLKIMGLAHIAMTRENHPEVLEDNP